MNWSDFKTIVDKELSERQIDGEEIEIEWIDTHCPEADILEVNISQGSDDRLEMNIRTIV